MPWEPLKDARRVKVVNPGVGERAKGSTVRPLPYQLYGELVLSRIYGAHGNLPTAHTVNIFGRAETLLDERGRPVRLPRDRGEQVRVLEALKRQAEFVLLYLTSTQRGRRT